MEKVKLGIVGFTDKGDWVSGYNYTKASTGETVTGYNVNVQFLRNRKSLLII